MPYISEKINLNKQIGLDRRIKLTQTQKEKIRFEYFNSRHKSTLKILSKGVSQRTLAKKYKVSRRCIVWVLYPDRLEINKQLRQDRGGSKQYYNTAKNTQSISNTRRWKQILYINKIIKKGENNNVNTNQSLA